MELSQVEYKLTSAINKNISYELSALVDADSLFYGVFDYTKTLVWAGRVRLSETNQLKQELLDHGIKIRKVKIGILNSQHTIIPNDEFNTDTIQDIVTHVNYIDQPDQYIFRNEYSVQHKLRVLYAVEKEVIKTLNAAFDNCQLIHVNFAQIESITEAETSQDHQVRLCFYESTFCLTIVNKEQLLLCNTYDYDRNEDVLYFLGLAFDRLGLDHSTQSVEVGGYIPHDGELLTELEKYFGGIRYATGYIKSKLASTEEHLHLPLYMISKCA